jgi:beta-phosphoglucomutase-like phosphatase (HAD superfamily)
MYKSNKKLIILDADGTTIDTNTAIEKAYSLHGMKLGDEPSFQKRHHLFKPRRTETISCHPTQKHPHARRTARAPASRKPSGHLRPYRPTKDIEKKN